MRTASSHSQGKPLVRAPVMSLCSSKVTAHPAHRSPVAHSFDLTTQRIFMPRSILIIGDNSETKRDAAQAFTEADRQVAFPYRSSSPTEGLRIGCSPVSCNVTDSEQAELHFKAAKHLSPGLAGNAMAAGFDTKSTEEMLRQVPLGRTTRTEEVAASRFLANDDAYMTGAALAVDGGTSMGR
ncbi:SDR family oxidoreductase [Streptomyces pseudovenezuelae]|uniref:SDR family oxidoreductase n=1 Tax=Streptomyces pseudovenezuelae TaxID=67350 RepID=UPI0037151C45